MNFHKDNPIRCSIVICTKDRVHDTQKCLASLAAQTESPDEVVVVDSGSDNTDAIVRQYAVGNPAVRVNYLRSEPGLTLQRNVGIRAATCDILHFLDDDVILDPDYIAEIQRVFRLSGNEDVVAVSPILRLPKQVSPARMALFRFFGMPHINGTGRMLPSGFGSYTWYSGYTDVHELEVGCGCCAYRRSIFDRITFDEHFYGYGFLEDLEFSYRAGKLGRILCNPKAGMLHVETPSARTDHKELAAMQIYNHYYVFKKHLPKTPYHWAWFWWSELGFSLQRLNQAIRQRNTSWITGMAAGYGSIIRGRPRKKG
ncbi:MAG: hypothetical protein AMXMBFR84_30550 [Candidatus Hydrogenedentota bacterium]